ncbi:MAG: pyrimidine 5'-nucleotidase [Alphaproteobacteria bacterium]
MTALEDVKLWIFDLDNTLYSDESGIGRQMGDNMTRFVANTLDMPMDQAKQARKDFFRRYGTTMRGLMEEHGTDPHHFMDYVHDVDTSRLTVDAQLQSALAALPGRRVIYTNASAKHAENICDTLGIADLFEHVFDIAAAEFAPKPDMRPYQTLLSKLGHVDGKGACMFEDMAINLEPAHQLGMATVLVETPHNADTPQTAHIHHRAPCLTSWLSARSG